ncbi:3-hydroxyphenylacetate 6-hydroxylase [Lachnellula occidentalis]|uniref:3-hydroxyphenylacetate 6-hydroxylase n=1 Tax=Lachnellula occidentalis TaxID=215460 RepID=A0A8H8S6A2_9HELO|nr:3-hydroxyphenylacetate 6-hydroxylase [Lachnellula occidentalis]
MAIESLIQSILAEAMSNPVRFSGLSIIVSFIGYILINEYTRKATRIPGLGGPAGLPLIGNIWQMRKNAAETYRQWARSNGSVYQIQLGNIPIVVVNSAAAARSLFGQNAQAMSSRPEFYTFHKILSDTAGTTIGTSPYSDSFKHRRKGAASALNKPSIATYIPHLDLESKTFISDLLKYGKAGSVAVDPMPMIQRLSLSLALTLNWGVRMESKEDPLFSETTHVEEEVSRFRSTTGNLQDYIPLLRLNPFNFGSKKAREMRSRRDVYLKQLNRDLDARIEKGTHKPCIQANVILDKETKLNKEELTSISLTMLSGGHDTITTLLQWSIALLSQRPDIQKKAWAEISELYSAE